MRFQTLVVLIPTAVLAQSGILFELGRMQERLASWLPQSASVATSRVIDTAASTAAGTAVHQITQGDHKTYLIDSIWGDGAKPGIDEWMVLVTGSNKSCTGGCQSIETAWNKSVVLMEATGTAPHLGLLNCETETVLCAAWAVRPAMLMHMLIPHPSVDQSHPATTVRYIKLNSTMKAKDIAAIHTEDRYVSETPYEGLFHPFDGMLAKYGLSMSYGYIMAAFNKVPTWVYMIGVSMGTRRFTNRRTAQSARPSANANKPVRAKAGKKA